MDLFRELASVNLAFEKNPFDFLLGFLLFTVAKGEENEGKLFQQDSQRKINFTLPLLCPKLKIKK